MIINENPGCLGFFLRILGIGSSPEETSREEFPYIVREDFLSPTERAFYGVLCSATGSRGVVCPKVRLADVFVVAPPRRHRTAFNRIAQKHVDFLICDPGTMRPLLGVELDDASHARMDRQTRDAFVEEVFRGAGLTLLRLPVQRGYNLQELSARIDSLLNESPSAVDIPRAVSLTGDGATDTGSNLPPMCPNCAVPMVMRTARKAGCGEPFYACLNYPRCHLTLPTSARETT